MESSSKGKEMTRSGNFSSALPNMVHAKAMGTESAIEALRGWMDSFILINPQGHAFAKMVARHPHFQADTFATREQAEGALREWCIKSAAVAEADYEVRQITSEFIDEFRRLRGDMQRPQGPTHR